MTTAKGTVQALSNSLFCRDTGQLSSVRQLAGAERAQDRRLSLWPAFTAGCGCKGSQKCHYSELSNSCTGKTQDGCWTDFTAKSSHNNSPENCPSWDHAYVGEVEWGSKCFCWVSILPKKATCEIWAQTSRSGDLISRSEAS